MDQPITWYEGSGLSDRRYLSSDERGSVISVTGSSTTLNKYDEYGVPQSTNLGKFGYTGQVWVPEIGLWYYKARFLRPDIGRFMQTDPIGYAAGPNLYAYVLNDPVNWVDPLGLDGCPHLEGDITVCGKRPPPCTYQASCSPFGGPTGFWVVDILAELGADLRDRLLQCRVPGLTKAEREAAQRGDRKAFWESRARRGDPFARTALNVVNNRGWLGQGANSILAGAIRRSYAAAQPTDFIRSRMSQIGVALMRAHAAEIGGGGTMTVADVHRYHVQVFTDFGLPPSTFGGTANTGSETVSEATSLIWSECAGR